MDLTISSQESIRILSKIVTYSSKISDTIQLTPQAPNLIIRVLNSSQSAFSSFKLCPSFFTRSEFGTTPQKLYIKSLLPILRSPQSINILHITTTPLTITVNTKTVTKTFTPPLQQGRVPAIAMSSCPKSQIVTTPSLFHNLLQNFHSRLDELTIIPSPTSFKLVSFLDQATPENLILRTQITVSPTQFDQHVYLHSEPMELTLFYRPFRAAIDFCQPFEETIMFEYEQPGQPVSVVMNIFVDAQVAVVATFVFASRLPLNPNLKRPTLGSQIRQESQVERASDAPDVHMFKNPLPGMDASQYEAQHEEEEGEEEEEDDDDFVEGTPPPE